MYMDLCESTIIQSFPSTTKTAAKIWNIFIRSPVDAWRSRFNQKWQHHSKFSLPSVIILCLSHGSDQAAGGSAADTWFFKGHPQPPPDDRLREAKNYLADEDVNRNLDFRGRLAQIDQYTKDLEEKKYECDRKLLQDVKTMAKVQREWMDYHMDAPPCDKSACDPDYVPHLSTRLVSKEAGRVLQEEREAMGLQNQMREDHAPFSIVRNDQIAFLDKLKKDSCENPGTVDGKTNLLWVENRAYGWALREPSLIPVWLHPRLGIPNKGIKITDQDP